MGSGNLQRLRFAAVFGAFLLGSWNSAEPAQALTPAWAPRLLVEAAGAPQALAAAYDLPVVPVAPVPEKLLGVDPAALDRNCPFEVRAVIVGEDPADSSALLAWDDDIAGSETQLVKVGQSLRVGGARWQVSQIEADQLVLARGDAAVRCALAKITR